MLQELYEPLGMTGCGFGPTTTTTDKPAAQPWGESYITSSSNDTFLGHLGDSWNTH